MEKVSWNQVGVSLDLDLDWHKAESRHFNEVTFTTRDANNMKFLSNFKPTHEICDTHGVLLFKYY